MCLAQFERDQRGRSEDQTEVGGGQLSLGKVVSVIVRPEGELGSPQSGEELSVSLGTEIALVPEQDQVVEGGAGGADDWEADILTLSNVETHQSLPVFTEDGGQQRTQGLARLNTLLSDVELPESLEVVEGEETVWRLRGVEDEEDLLGQGRGEAGHGEALLAALQTGVESPEAQTGGEAGLHHQLLDDGHRLRVVAELQPGETEQGLPD